MAIQVLCTGCKARFKVSEKFAGQKGPCPKCKAIITIPAATEEIVIHEPEHSEVGARGTSGQLVLKPIERSDGKFEPLVLAAFGGLAILSLAIAFILRGAESVPTFMLAIGAIALAPPMCWAGYQLLRSDEELEPFQGKALWIRTAICAVLYAALWALFSLVYARFLGTDPAEVMHIVFFAPPFVLAGAGVAFCCYDFDLGTGAVHYSFYLLVTIALRLIMGLPPVGPTG